MPRFEVTVKRIIETDDYDPDELHDALMFTEQDSDGVGFEAGRDAEVSYTQEQTVSVDVRKL